MKWLVDYIGILDEYISNFPTFVGIPRYEIAD